MAATVSSLWGKPGAWPLDAEEHEAELQQQAASILPPKSSSVSVLYQPPPLPKPRRRLKPFLSPNSLPTALLTPVNQLAQLTRRPSHSPPALANALPRNSI
ncbi:hypothetical protein V6N12_030456 [Hibiscus sabdariffa]|uniref:Uncharacterized protein n=1 Tax=Hibiscus sabdariffa TaxID=183260 RepID=A0ABR2C142_9ROSI